MFEAACAAVGLLSPRLPRAAAAAFGVSLTPLLLTRLRDRQSVVAAAAGVALRALLAAEAASVEGVCGAALGTGVGGEGDGAWKKLGPDGRRNVVTALCAAVGEGAVVRAPNAPQKK